MVRDVIVAWAAFDVPPQSDQISFANNGAGCNVVSRTTNIGSLLIGEERIIAIQAAVAACNSVAKHARWGDLCVGFILNEHELGIERGVFVHIIADERAEIVSRIWSLIMIERIEVECIGDKVTLNKFTRRWIHACPGALW